MADNVNITAGAGTTIATDQCGTDHYQRIKLTDGTADSTTHIYAAEGVVTNALRVCPANNISDATYIGDIKFGEAEPNSAAIKTAVELLDNAVDGNFLNVNCNIAGTDIVGGAGAVAAGVQRITLASDDPAVVDLAAIEVLLGTIDADTSTIATDTTSIDGKITACDTGAVVLAASDGTDIGNVDVASVVPGTGATNLGKAEDAAHSTGDVGVMALAVRQDSQADFGADGDYVPLSIDANGALRVSGGGGGTEYTEDDAAPANPVGTAILAERDDALGGLTPAAGDWSHLFCDANGALWVHDDALDAALSGTELQVDVVGALPAGDNNIGNVDIVTVPAPLNVVGGGVEEYALRVTIASDSTGVVSIDDGGNTITVDGSVTVSATDLDIRDLTSVSDSVEVLQDTASDLNCTEASASDIKTAVEIMDDWDAVHDSAASTDGPQLMAAYDATKPTAVGDGDAVRVLADEYGRLLSGVEKTRFQAVYDSSNATGEAEVVKASAASTIIVVQSYVISSDVEGWIKLQDEDSTALTGKFWLKAGGGVAITLPENAPIVLGVDKDLEVICEAAGDVSVSVTGYTIPG